ncbi:bifunctional methylenetetrahydrofolate dehydrogenase/methenyltetrahydrofolate cyclohydrolase FolD [Pseudomaricurvus alkylphenolicus]|jgi:methylenetetrahydrofolate dehydrogenase (NADP+)/methenyltetrahydrofolate cyclohydrolase|uniref:bifunctional methylenetetrahydrofolate dehydrogenase/methenyltetrahydrofolate cyclohydrolase FolD n=1 Tax=Pseudomaricurvus alkylphenolicus TaxID=1306991 RepID=UPI0023F71487|nr:bifunctional methylenetetrahydrofolate dehydrogenase/methenyltetrahydrofolate cyclohydrolase FolD [Pseudomaricurvus alkylphenolicus]
MMVIDGKSTAENLRQSIADSVRVLIEQYDLQPGLAVILVGEDPASQVYVRNKVRQTLEVGMKSMEYRMPPDISQAELLARIDQLNNDPAVNGILVQLPLPAHIDENAVIETIAPEKDVDGFHTINSGRLMNGQTAALVPCTPQGCIILAKQHLGDDLSGKHAVVIGRSNIVGKPVALLLLQENCTVTLAHSRTENLGSLCSDADIIVAAVGRPQMIKGDWIKPGATVIDVGINRIDTAAGKTQLVGDVDYAEAQEVAGAITPVPGGVGPMTIACLLQNTLTASCSQRGIAIP